MNKNICLLIDSPVYNIFEKILEKNPSNEIISKLIGEFSKRNKDITDYIIWNEPVGSVSVNIIKENGKNGNITKPQATRIGRAIKDIFDKNGEMVSESQVEFIVNSWKSITDITDIEIVKGEDIKFWYLRENYAFPGPAERPNNNPPSISTSRQQRLRDDAVIRRNPGLDDVLEDTLELDNDEPLHIVGGEHIQRTNEGEMSTPATPRESIENRWGLYTATTTSLFGRPEPIQPAIEYPSKGSLSKSCMRYPVCTPLLDIYTTDDNIFMLIIKNDENKLLARALVWKLNDGTYLMDRVYYSDESHIVKFENYANSKGWIYAQTKYFPGDRRWTLNGVSYHESEIKFNFKLDKKYTNWPYIDTFCYYDWVNNILTSSRDKITTKTCLEFRDIRGSAKIILNKHGVPFIQEEIDWIFENNNFNILLKEGGIGKISKESKELILKKSYENGWDMSHILNPNTWEFEEWFEFAKRSCDRGCLIGVVNLSHVNWNTSQWNLFLNEKRIAPIKQNMSFINVPLDIIRQVLKEFGWEYRKIDMVPELLNLPDDMAIDYLNAIKMIFNANNIYSTHKNANRLEELLYQKRNIDSTDIDLLAKIFSNKIRNGQIIENKWILRLSEEQRINISSNSYHNYSINIFAQLDVASYLSNTNKKSNNKMEYLHDYKEFKDKAMSEIKIPISSKKIAEMKVTKSRRTSSRTENTDPIYERREVTITTAPYPDYFNTSRLEDILNTGSSLEPTPTPTTENNTDSISSSDSIVDLWD